MGFVFPVIKLSKIWEIFYEKLHKNFNLESNGISRNSVGATTLKPAKTLTAIGDGLLWLTPC
ncbi:MAG: hypothetical protein ACI30R_02265, partial [Sodaliphilus sp.]